MVTGRQIDVTVLDDEFAVLVGILEDVNRKVGVLTAARGAECYCQGVQRRLSTLAERPRRGGGWMRWLFEEITTWWWQELSRSGGAHVVSPRESCKEWP